MQDGDMSERILARFETRLAETGDISSRTREVLSGTRNSGDFGADEQLLEDLVDFENK